MIYTETQKREHIRELQRYLQALSMFNKKLLYIIPDGIFGNETATAVRAFQREYGLMESGAADSATWNKLVAVYRNFLSHVPVSYNIFPSKNYILREGDDGLLVYIIQAMLNDFGKRHDNLISLNVDGAYGKATADAVKKFQRSVNLNRTGAVNAPTWNMLALTSEHDNNIR